MGETKLGIKNLKELFHCSCCSLGCPKGWTQFRSYCYLVSGSIKSWDYAQEFCKQHGGELVKINSFEENEFVLKLVNQCHQSLKQVWIGLRRQPGKAGKFLWSDNSIPFFKNWAPHEPNGGEGEPCGHMFTGHRDMIRRASGTWNDLPCRGSSYLPNGFVCKRLNRLCS
ncbi:snaclec coagulation factor IX-binding protein subunit A-like [Porites lutea]